MARTRVWALGLLLAACGGATPPPSSGPTPATPAPQGGSDGAPVSDGEPAAPPRPEGNEHFSFDGNDVTKAAFEQALRDFDVDADPWVNAHVQDVKGNSGSSATYEARHKKTRLPWTLEIMAVGGRESRRLFRGSHKSRASRIQ